MSNPETALAVAGTQAAAVPAPEKKPSAGMTLLEGIQAFSTDRPDVYAMPEDEQEELDDIRVRITRIKHDGSKGYYLRTDDKEKKETWPAMRYAILAKLDDSQVLFPSKEEKANWPKYICRADSIHGVPILHPEMTEAQKAKALELKVGGALGQKCTGCVHAQWRHNPATGRMDLKPTCSTINNLLAYSGSLKEPVIQSVKGTSIKYLDRHLGEFKKIKSSLYTFISDLGSKAELKDGEEWQVMTFTKGEECGAEAVLMFREMRRQLLPAITDDMRRTTGTVFSDDDIGEAEEPKTAAPVGAQLPPVDLLAGATEISGILGEDVPF